MDEKTISGIMGIIEGLDAENMALKSYLKTCSNPMTDEQIEQLVQEALNLPGFREKVAGRWQRLRSQIQSDKALEEAISRFARIVPPTKDLN
jgi:hypothetical protein